MELVSGAVLPGGRNYTVLEHSALCRSDRSNITANCPQWRRPYEPENQSEDNSNIEKYPERLILL